MAPLAFIVVFNFIQNNFVRLNCDSCHISVHLEKLIKIGEFLYSHFNIKDGRKYTTFSAYYILFQKGKNTTEMQKKKICAVYAEGAVTDQMCQKWFAKFYAGDFSLDDAPYGVKTTGS